MDAGGDGEFFAGLAGVVFGVGGEGVQEAVVDPGEVASLFEGRDIPGDDHRGQLYAAEFVMIAGSLGGGLGPSAGVFAPFASSIDVLLVRWG